MGMIPKKAFYRKNLRDLAYAAIDSSHQIIRVEFIDDGVKKTGFLKKLEPKNHYPELLARISVATSVLHRSYMGELCAEEHLVYDDDDKIMGTLSVALDGFKPFNYAKEDIPSGDKEQVIPSTKTLIEKNFIAAAFAYWFGDNDDGHPHNNGFAKLRAVILDFDMFFYWFVIWMKEPRPVVGNPKNRIDLTVRDWETFPNVQDSKPYHWPTYEYPGRETLPVVVPVSVQGPILRQALPKNYPDFAQFEQLAHEPEAHKQKFAAAMNTLLTFQPEVMRKRLVEYLGTDALNYTSLDEIDVNLRATYEKAYPELCNPTTNAKPFVDFIMAMYQKHYDNLYRVVVMYMGCANNGYGVALNSTCSTLYHEPSVFRKIEDWVKVQNETLYSTGEKYDLLELHKRYHQIWRDAYTPLVNDMRHDCYQLIKKVIEQATTDLDVAEIEGKNVSDENLTSSWQMLNTMPELSREKILPSITIDKDNKLRDGLLSLIDFINEFNETVNSYYGKKREQLTEEDNIIFVEKLKKLDRFNRPLRQYLSHTTTPAEQFNRLSLNLKQLIEQVDFDVHLTTTDEQMKDTRATTSAKEVLPHTHVDVIKQFNESLFLWAKNLKPTELTRYINEIIDKYYAPYWTSFSPRKRAERVKAYLESSQFESGENRLANIFSSGDVETGALNEALVQHLTPLVLQTYPLLSVRNAVREGVFNASLLQYTKATVDFAKQDKNLVHLHNNAGVELFHRTMYEWINKLPNSTFDGIIKSALTAYESQLSWLSTSRRAEVEGYIKASDSKVQIIAMTFLKGEPTSSLNKILFEKIIAGMQTEINKSEEKLKLQGNKLIMQFVSIEEHKFVYDALKTYAIGPSHDQGNVKSNSAMTH